MKVRKQAAKRHILRQNSQHKSTRIKSEKDETQMFRHYKTEIGCEIECEGKKKCLKCFAAALKSKLRRGNEKDKKHHRMC